MASVILRRAFTRPIARQVASTLRFSTLSEALLAEKSEFQKQDTSLESIFEGSGFDVKFKSEASGHILLSRKNVKVEFDPSEFEHSGEQEVAVPMEVVIENASEKKQLTLACIARADDESGEVEIEEILIEKLGGDGGADALLYSPKIGELTEDMKEGFFEYLADHGVDDTFAMGVASAAEILEETRYQKWVDDVLDFVQKGN